MRVQVSIKVLMVCLLMGFVSVRAQTGSLHFKQITNFDGLLGSKVQAIAEDKLGFIWVGTTEGISRFDGNIFDHFPVYLDNDSIAEKPYITSIEVAENNQIWIGTRNLGLLSLNVSTKKFKQYLADKPTAKGLLHQWVHTVRMDRMGNFWVGDFLRNLFLYLPKVDSFLQIDITRPKHISEPFPNPYISEIILDVESTNTLWIATRDGLVKLELSSKKYTYYYPPEQFKGVYFYINKHINSMVQMPNQKLYLGFWGGGIWSFDPKNGTWENFLFDTLNPRSGGSNILHRLSKGENNKLYAACGDKGLAQFDIETKEYKFYDFELDLRLPEQDFNAIVSFVDSRNNIWFGGSTGIFVSYVHWQALEKYALPPPKSKFTPRLFRVSKWIELPNGNQLVGTFHGDGIHLLDKNFETIKVFQLPIPKNEPLRVNFLANTIHKMKVFVVLENDIFILNTDDGSSKQVDIKPFKKNRTEFAPLKGISLNGKLYAIFPDNKILEINELGKTKLVYTPSANNFEKPFFYNIIENNNNFLLGTNQGITQLNSNDWSTKNWFTFEDGDSIGSVARLTSDSVGNFFWLNPATKNIYYAKFTNNIWELKNKWHLTKLVSNDQVFDMKCDNQGHLWIYNGLQIRRIDPILGDGLTINPGEGMANITSFVGFTFNSKNEFIIETIVGFYKFNPLKEYLFTEKPYLYINNISINGVPVDWSKLPSSLPFNQNNIQIDFGLLSFIDRNRYSIRYKIFKNEKMGAAQPIYNRLSLSNLSPDKYSLCFELLDKGKPVEASIIELPIRILPPFYETWFFRLLLLLILSTLFYYFYLLKTKQIKREIQLASNFEKQILSLEMSALRAQMNPHFIFNSLNAIKMLMIENQSKDAIHYLNRFSRLVRVILQNSKDNLITVEQEIEALKLYVEMEQLRFNFGFDFTFEIEDNIDPKTTYLPPLLIQPYFENAIWHGILHQTKRGLLELKFRNLNHSLVIEIKDNGVGRDAAMAMKSKSALNHKSFGMKITGDRIKNINTLYQMNADASILDLYNTDGTPAGTLVSIYLPNNLKP